MSSALAIAGVTAVLRDLLNDGMVNHNVSGVLGSTVTVTARPPDRVVAPSGTEAAQLNVFLHAVTPNAGWRNERLPSRDTTGRVRLTNPVLALDLHYLVSAYGADDLHPEILLGYAMQLLHETPALDRPAITTALNPSPSVGTSLPPALRALAECGLADQVESLKVTPEHLSTEELSKLWTAIQAHYRPSAAYLVSVVLIESAAPTRPTLPVLSRGPVDAATGRDRGVVVSASLQAPYPTLTGVSTRDRQPAVAVGAPVELTGHHLAGSGAEVRFVRLPGGAQTAAAPAATGEAAWTVVVPPLAVGAYQVSVRVQPPGDAAPRDSNQLPLVVGPSISTPLPATVIRDGNGTAHITLACQPPVQTGQRVSLVLGAREVPALPFADRSSTVEFVCEAAPVGEHLVRLRVDGIDSPLVDMTATPPAFLDARITIQ